MGKLLEVVYGTYTKTIPHLHYNVRRWRALFDVDRFTSKGKKTLGSIQVITTHYISVALFVVKVESGIYETQFPTHFPSRTFDAVFSVLFGKKQIFT